MLSFRYSTVYAFFHQHLNLCYVAHKSVSPPYFVLISLYPCQRSFRSFSNDDRHVMAKHSTIYPSSHDLEAVQTLVSTVECALKHVSDWLDQSSGEARPQFDSQKPESTEEDDPGDDPTDEAEDSSESHR